MDEYSELERLFCRVYGGVRVLFVADSREQGLEAAAETLAALAKEAENNGRSE